MLKTAEYDHFPASLKKQTNLTVVKLVSVS